MVVGRSMLGECLTSEGAVKLFKVDKNMNVAKYIATLDRKSACNRPENGLELLLSAEH